MHIRTFSISAILLVVTASLAIVITARGREPQGGSVIHVEVSLVQLNVAVTDNKGNYITDLKPSDFKIAEDGISQQIATFERGNEGPVNLADNADAPAPKAEASPSAAASPVGPASPAAPAPDSTNIQSAVNGANVFILFDTSNYMYRGQGFVFAQDAIEDFVRTLDRPYRVAFYSYSRDFFRAANLTEDRSAVLHGVRTTVNGDDSALYNALLLTLKDAAQVSGRKVVVVFSNGPDNASMVAPEDVAELAQSEGIPIYMISTREAKLDPASSTVFARISANTGGTAYYAKNWEEERQAFAAIREDLAHLYYLSYYPQSNPNRGWRAISVKLTDPKIAKKYHIRTRNGYRPIPAHITVDTTTAGG